MVHFAQIPLQNRGVFEMRQWVTAKIGIKFIFAIYAGINQE